MHWGKKILQGKCLCVNSVFLSLLTFLYSLYNFFTLSMDYFYNWKKQMQKQTRFFCSLNPQFIPFESSVGNYFFIDPKKEYFFQY